MKKIISVSIAFGMCMSTIQVCTANANSESPEIFINEVREVTNSFGLT